MKKLIIALIIIFFCGWLVYPFILQGMANFLVVQDQLEKADAILVLAGDANGERVAQAVELYKAGWAKKIIMSGGPAVWNLTYAQNMRNQAKYLGVQPEDIFIQDKSESTYEDIKFSLPILQNIGVMRLILVSSPYHMRRMTQVARKMYNPKGIKVIPYPVKKSKWKADKWWTRHEDTQLVIWEYIAMIEYLLKGWLF
jgi:uncharacterized SAM-binding protein YcdF (DUF218 family)